MLFLAASNLSTCDWKYKLELEDHWVPRHAYGFSLEKTAEQQFLLQSDDGLTVIEMNETSALIWQLVDDQRTQLEIVVLLQDLYPEASDEVASHTRQLIADMIDFGALYTLM